MSDLHAMFINNITHSACYTVEMGVSARDLTRNTLDNNHTAYKHICLQGIGCVCVKSCRPEIMQPSSSTRATIVSAENQNGATIVKATFFFCHYYIVWESNNAGEARGQSWNESLKSRWIPGGSCGYTSGTKRKHFAALSSPRPCWRWLQLQPSCGSPQCLIQIRREGCFTVIPFLLDYCEDWSEHSQIAKFMGPTWGPPGPCRPQMGPMLAPWILLSG